MKRGSNEISKEKDDVLNEAYTFPEAKSRGDKKWTVSTKEEFDSYLVNVEEKKKVTWEVFGATTITTVELLCREDWKLGNKECAELHDIWLRHPTRKLFNSFSSQPGFYQTPSKMISAVSMHPPPIPISAVKEDRAVDASILAFVAELGHSAPIYSFVNGVEFEFKEGGQWLQAVDCGGIKNRTEVRQLLKIPNAFKLSDEEVELFGLIHDSDGLHTKGETEYQKWFNEQNITEKKSNYLLKTHSANDRIPVAKQHENEYFSFSGKTDNLSLLRPMAIEFKGTKFQPEHQPLGNLADRHYNVLEQAIRRVYSISCVQQYIANISVFAVCFDRIWMVWYTREMVPAERRQGQSINIIAIDPKDFGYFWALLTKQALNDRTVMYMENDIDYYYLINFLNNIHPKMAHYCRTRFVSMSMNRVYAVSLPQAQSANAKTICVSKNHKHFALKVIPSKAQFDQEVQCIAQVNKYLDEHDGEENEFPFFYAFGSQRWNENYQSHTQKVIFALDYIRQSMVSVFGKPTKSGLSTVAVEPWWLYHPTPPCPLEGGVIVMLCGDLYNQPTPDDLKPMREGIQYWLNLYHNAGVVHRDLRLSNIMRFDLPPSYNPYANLTPKYLPFPGNKRLQWQLIDFNLGYCLKENETEVKTKLQRCSAQWENAGWSVQKKLEEAVAASGNLEPIVEVEVPWSFSDDDQMFLNLITVLENKILRIRN